MRGKLLGGRYRMLRRIGEGGMAFVYLAKDEKLNRQVAIKILHKHMAENADIRNRFFQEAHAISALDHPNILKIYDFSGERSDELWMTMEVLQGLNLSEYVQTFPGKWLHPVIAAMICREILKALQIAHQEGLIHRDVKPENIFVLNAGRIKLMDFGIVKNLRSNSMTLTGTFMGSPSYMSPEQIRGKSIDHRSDLYSLGVLFYEIVSSRLPYTGNTTHDVVMKICEGKFKEPKVHVPNLPKDLNQIICKAMAKHPMHRYQEARTFARDLDIFLNRHGFEESHIELERYFADKEKFERRLRKLKFTNKSTLHTKATQQTPLPPAKTTRTRMLNNLDRNALQKNNRINMENPQPKSRLPTPPPPPIRMAMRANRQIAIPISRPPRSRYSGRQPLVSKQAKPMQFTHQQAAFDPTVFDPKLRIKPHAAHRPQRPGHLNRRRVRPRYPKHRASSRRVYAYRHSAYLVHTVHTSPWLTPLIGAFLVGLIGLLSLAGFNNLIKRMPKDRPSNLSNQMPPRPNTKLHRQAKPQTAPIKHRGPTAAPTEKPVVNAKPTVQTRRLPTQLPKKHQHHRSSTPPSKVRPSPAARATAAPTRIPATLPPAIPTPVAASNPQLRLSSRPAAEIFIDGRRVGTTVDRTLNSGWITVRPGKRKIELRRSGYKTYVTQMRVEPGQQRSLPTINLQADVNFLLTLSSNKSPVKVLIVGLSSGSRKNFVLRRSRSQVLPTGRYRIRFEHQGRIVERNISLEGAQSKFNLNVEF